MAPDSYRDGTLRTQRNPDSYRDFETFAFNGFRLFQQPQSLLELILITGTDCGSPIVFRDTQINN